MNEIDALIVGAGPVGLFQAFQLGLQEVHAHIVDVLPQAGGQCMALYPDKPIYDIPGIPSCTGRGLTENLLQQLKPFAPSFHCGALVCAIALQSDGRLLVSIQSKHTSPSTSTSLSTSSSTSPTTSSTTQQFLTKTLFIAAGVGAFMPRRLAVEGLDPFEGRQLHYALSDALALAPTSRGLGKNTVIIGDGDAALEAAIEIALAVDQQGATSSAQSGQPTAHSITLIHRREAFTAQPETVAQFRNLLASGKVQFMAGQVSGFESDGDVLRHLHISRPDGSSQSLPVDTLLVLQGLSPKLGPLADWGLALERKQISVNPATCATAIAGVFAIGDITTYAGKKKLILCGFHECVLATYAALPFIDSNKSTALEYTTTSSRLHRILGV